jgi:hypothetical protein
MSHRPGPDGHRARHPDAGRSPLLDLRVRQAGCSGGSTSRPAPAGPHPAPAPTFAGPSTAPAPTPF